MRRCLAAAKRTAFQRDSRSPRPHRCRRRPILVLFSCVLPRRKLLELDTAVQPREERRQLFAEGCQWRQRRKLVEEQVCPVRLQLRPALVTEDVVRSRDRDVLHRALVDLGHQAARQPRSRISVIETRPTVYDVSGSQVGRGGAEMPGLVACLQSTWRPVRMPPGMVLGSVRENALRCRWRTYWAHAAVCSTVADGTSLATSSCQE
jgi:hypothetical protein